MMYILYCHIKAFKYRYTLKPDNRATSALLLILSINIYTLITKNCPNLPVRINVNKSSYIIYVL